MPAQARGRELYVYWHVPALDRALALQAAQALQREVSAALPAISARLLQRADEDTGHFTLMEIYAASLGPNARQDAGPDAAPVARLDAAATQHLTPVEQALIESLALQHLAVLPALPQRHVEVFEAV